MGTTTLRAILADSFIRSGRKLLVDVCVVAAAVAAAGGRDERPEIDRFCYIGASLAIASLLLPDDDDDRGVNSFSLN